MKVIMRGLFYLALAGWLLQSASCYEFSMNNGMPGMVDFGNISHVLGGLQDKHMEFIQRGKTAIDYVVNWVDGRRSKSHAKNYTEAFKTRARYVDPSYTSAQLAQFCKDVAVRFALLRTHVSWPGYYCHL
jgi:hypothetical protein